MILDDDFEDKIEAELARTSDPSDRIRELEAAIAKAEGERAEQWRLRREAEASRDLQAAIASSEEGRARRLEAKLREALSALKPFEKCSTEGLCQWETETGYVTMTTQADYFHRARTVAQLIEKELGS